MASVSQSPVTFSASRASDLLTSSSDFIKGVPLKALGRARFSTTKRNFSVSAKLRPVKKREYPWPSNPDPNVRGGVLSHLSEFKPLAEKQKPVTLDFEMPLLEIEKKIVEVRKMANKTGLDFSNQIMTLERKYEQALRDLYTHLTPIQRVKISRHPNRPTFLDHVFNMTDKFVELHGDRAGYDDPAIVTGIGTIGGKRYMFIGHQKGRNTKENLKRNFGMPTPHGYRKALRMMYYAEHHKFPIITFIDTPGAYADPKSEELGQGEAIAQNIRSMFGLKVPIVSIVIGEGGSGGALAIGCGNKLLMLENAVFYVASPEACAAILWKNAAAAPEAAEMLKITGKELCKLDIADDIIPEPLGGAHVDPEYTSQQMKAAIMEAMGELEQMSTEELLKHRMRKFRKIGAAVQEGIPLDPEKIVNMKKKDEPGVGNGSVQELQNRVEKVKQQVLKAKESSAELPESALSGMIEELRQEVDYEFLGALKALGLEERFVALKEEVSKASSQERLLHPALKDKIERLRLELNQRLSEAPNYGKLRSEVDMLKELSKSKVPMLKLKVDRKIKEVINRADVKQKREALMAEFEKFRELVGQAKIKDDIDAETSGASKGNEVEREVKEKFVELRGKIIQMKKEVEAELTNAFKSLGLDAKMVKSTAKNFTRISNPELRTKVNELNEEIKEGLENIISSTDVKDKIESLKMELAKAGKQPDSATRSRIQALQKQIKQDLVAALDSSKLKDGFENLKEEILKAKEPSGPNGSPRTGKPGEGSSAPDTARMEVNVEAGSSSA